MPYKVMFGEIKTREDGTRYSDKEVDLYDLAPSVFSAIARQLDIGLTHRGIFHFPYETPEAAFAVVRAAAEYAGLEAPVEPPTMREEEELERMFEQTQDIGDQSHVDGFPKAASETESGSSITSPDLLTTGPPASPDSSPTET